ncbi:hypothetical protein VOLCADRAFT_94036 [Volvox carteri f. nagariensis]|uniref:Uncharacterized protein n=1 Tax=Volvox carteri f. nagariensis TaxID=3068 RepID=D8U3R5_VOLCA|nr:uncharacterized protein VOLCADRAFT_94036 [Volvox carteri f. nagariensis]EFJ45574.1 hypothetical protein VOLCADRAFT_94036 [Volvox carteri f. nagariensis]|eukprot:XP_002953264.1 hypothetical protein VOLCADRAFT_94036 [Volvox carteri f. nagariensis]
MVNGCQVSMHTTEDQFVGPGRMPCRMFAMSGNLTGAGVEAQMWADVDGPGLLSYYYEDSEAVAALRYDSFRQLVRDIWAFLRHFTGDLRFANDSYGDAGAEGLMGEMVGEDVNGGAAVDRGRARHGPMRVYRTSETRVVVKAPTGCKYRYTTQ